jgi:hypothetical protein
MLWIRYALLRLRPFKTLDDIYAEYLESPGTKAYSVTEARQLFAGFSTVRTSVRLSPGDTLDGASGQRHTGAGIELARRVWPRAVIKRFFGGLGLFLLVEAVK